MYSILMSRHSAPEAAGGLSTSLHVNCCPPMVGEPPVAPALGWIGTTLFVTGFTGVVRRE